MALGDVSPTGGVDIVNDGGVEPDSGTDEKAPLTCTADVEDLRVSAVNDVGETASGARQAEKLREQVLGSQWQHGQRDTGIPREQIANGPIPARGHEAPQVQAMIGIRHPRGQTIAITKHPRPVTERFQLTDKLQQLPAACPRPRFGIALDHHKRRQRITIQNPFAFRTGEQTARQRQPIRIPAGWE